MIKYNEKVNGITLVSLVITIIILLILAGVSIAELTGNGLFAKAIEAKEKAEMSRLEEEMQLALTETLANKNGGSITLEDYMDTLNKKESIHITDSYEEDGKQIIVLDNKYVFEVTYENGEISVECIGVNNKLSPKLILKNIKNTTNSITVEITTKRNEGGKVEYYIKGGEYTDYTLMNTDKESKTEGTYTYSGLTQGVKYSIKIVAVAKNKQKAEVLVDRITMEIPALTEADIKFTYKVDGKEIDKETWTNKNVTVTASTTVTGYTLQTSKDGKTWSNETSQTFDENGLIYVALYDGKNYGGAATGNIINIDKLPPENFTPTAESTTKSITVKANTSDAEATSTNGKSGIAGYRFKLDNENWTEYQESGTYIWNNLEQTTSHTITVEAKDRAGNTTTGTVNKGTGTIPTLTEADIKFTYKVDGKEINKETWTNKDVTVTASTKITGYTIQTSKDGQTWSDETSQTFSENGEMYVVLYDGKNYGGSATGNIINIDKEAPIINSLTQGETTTSSIQVSASATDTKSGVNKYRYSSDGGTTWSDYTTSTIYKLENLFNGFGYPYSVVIEVTDKAGNVATRSETMATSIDRNYFVTEAGIELIRYNWETSGSGGYRKFTKTYSGDAIVGIAYMNEYIAPVLVSTNANAVAYCTSDSGNSVFSYSGSFEWGGTRYYCSASGYWFYKTCCFTSKYRNINQDNQAFISGTLEGSVQIASKELLNRYYSGNQSGYEINYNANSGSSTNTKTFFESGSSVTILGDITSKDGYHLLGWSKNYNSTSAEYSIGGTYSFDQSTTLYAIWQKHDFSDQSGICTICKKDMNYLNLTNKGENWQHGQLLNYASSYNIVSERWSLVTSCNITSNTWNSTNNGGGGLGSLSDYTTGEHNIGMIILKNKIDVTNIEKIVMKCSLYTNCTDLGCLAKLGLSNSNSLSKKSDYKLFETYVEDSNNVKDTAPRRIMELDVSSYTGEHYLKLTTEHDGNFEYNTVVTGVFSMYPIYK